MRRWKRIVIEIIVVSLFGVVLSATVEDHRPTVGHLKNAYLIFNDAYFYGGLPSTTRIAITDLSADDIMGRVSLKEDGRWLLEIDKKSHPLEKEAEMTVLHEMCHMEVDLRGLSYGDDKHGGNFQACMLRVAQKGGFRDLW